MDEQANPERSPQQSAPSATNDPSASAAYTAPPPAPARARRWGPLALVAALALGGIGVAVGRRAAPAAKPAPAAVVQAVEERASFEKDFDAETTAAAREVLRRDATTRELAALSAPGANADDATRSAALRQALRQLAAGSPELREGVAAGRIGFYTLRLPTSVGDGGDVYDISVDGAPLLRVTTRPGLASATIALETAKPHVVSQTLVFSAPRGADVVPENIEPLPAALAELPAEAAVRAKRAHRFIDTTVDPVPASGKSAPGVLDLSVKWVEESAKAPIESRRTKPTIERCIINLEDGDGTNSRQIGDFPCDCSAVHWTGNVGACSVAK